MSIDELQSSLVVHEQKLQRVCSDDEDQVLKVEKEDEDELLLMAYEELHEDKRSDVWVLDFGCSNHICVNQGMFASLDTTFSHVVKLGNNTEMKVIGKGVVKLVLKGISCVIGNVYYVLTLKNNLLSMGQLQEK
ncbi:uncharacterized protein LOC108466396 [Gossypium arboreum]|uniref:uncharacterized protein LOC108466396 n=1 Tax=Gossypium arboreum TaxID=29729 RepID=UPI00081963FE|nr:uncharacterized protein LOC108466396 [Gossypium arboreum]